MTKITVTYERESKVPDWATPQRIKSLKDNGMTLRQIGELAKVSHETIRKILLQAK